MKTVRVKIPEALDEQLTSVARRRKTKKSALVRRALTQFLEHERPAIKGSFFEAAKNFLGTATGPVDLSTNKKHMDGYGK